MDTKGLERQLASLSPPLSSSRPAIIDVVEDGETATVYAIVQTFSLRSPAQAGGSAHRAVESPATFSLVKENGEWKLANNRYIEQRVRAQQRADADAPQAQAEAE